MTASALSNVQHETLQKVPTDWTERPEGIRTSTLDALWQLGLVERRREVRTVTVWVWRRKAGAL